MSPVFVATLVADKERRPLSDALLGSAAQAVQGFRGSAVLSPGVAADLYFDVEDGALPSLEALLFPEGVDVIVQRAAMRAKRLIVADMDSTLIGQECVDELAKLAGVGDRVAAITERAMQGEIEFESALKERVALLAGLPVAAIDALLSDRIVLNEGARVLFRTMRKAGAYTAVVSGGFAPFTAEIAKRLEAHEHRANRLGVADGRLTGEVLPPILGREAKLAALKDLTARLALPREATLAVGDGANDLAMLGAAGLGVAYRAKPRVAAMAAARLDHADLTALLYAQGIAREAFVAD